MGVNGRSIGLGAASEIVEGRTLVPLRAVSVSEENKIAVISRTGENSEE